MAPPPLALPRPAAPAGESGRAKLAGALLAIALLPGACGESERGPPASSGTPPAAVPAPTPLPEVPAAPAAAALAPVADDVSEHPRLGAYVPFPGAGVRMRAPEGYEQPAAFHGFARPAATCSVVATKVPAPFAEVTKGFTEEQFEARGWTLESKEETTVTGRPGMLVKFRQPAGGTTYRKCLLAWGDEASSTFVTASSPEDAGDEEASLLERVVLSARATAQEPGDAAAELPYTVEVSPKLRRATVMGKTSLFSKDGSIRQQDPESPMFLVGPALGAAIDAGAGQEERRRHAEDRVRRTATVESIEVRGSEPVAIDGLEGFETLADAKHTGSGAPLLLHQVLLFDGSSYVIMQGLVGAAAGDEYLPEFRAMARSFRRNAK